MTAGDWVEHEVEEPSESRPTVAANRSSPERTVFTEDGNTDAWIATDLTVELRR